MTADQMSEFLRASGGSDRLFGARDVVAVSFRREAANPVRVLLVSSWKPGNSATVS